MTFLRRTTRLVAALALAGAATIGTAVDQPALAAAAPTHVAIAVDFGSQGDVQVACVPSGGTGSAVLGARFQVEYNKTGLVVKINSVGSVNPPRDLYWSYWHSSGGSWSYANSGPATFHPAAGTVEGWAYNNGSTGPATSPSYATICAGQDPAPPPTHAPTHAPPVARHPSPPPAAQPGQPGPAGQPNSSTGPSTSNGSSASSGARSTPPTTRHASSAPTKPTSRGAESTGSSTSNATQPAAQLVGAKQGGQHTSAAPAVGTGLALLAVAALGGTAFWRLRRQKHG